MQMDAILDGLAVEDVVKERFREEKVRDQSPGRRQWQLKKNYAKTDTFMGQN